MIKLISKQDPQPVAKTKLMYEMRPLEVCVVVDTTGYKDHVVMRTASIEKFEGIDLTTPRPGCCWTLNVPITVRELYPGETYTLELS